MFTAFTLIYNYIGLDRSCIGQRRSTLSKYNSVFLASTLAQILILKNIYKSSPIKLKLASTKMRHTTHSRIAVVQTETQTKPFQTHRLYLFLCYTHESILKEIRHRRLGLKTKKIYLLTTPRPPTTDTTKTATPSWSATASPPPCAPRNPSCRRPPSWNPTSVSETNRLTTKSTLQSP